LIGTYWGSMDCRTIIVSQYNFYYRTPLNCITVLSNLLLDDPGVTDPALAETIRMIANGCDMLSDIVNDVLDYSKLASHKVEVRNTPTNLRRTIAVVTETLQVKARELGLTLRTNIDGHAPDIIITDGRRVQQILYNLIGNAIKFGNANPESPKYIDVDVHSVSKKCETLNGQGGGREYQSLQFSIRDYGIGIDPTHLKAIFEPFQQAIGIDDDQCIQQATVGGTGLGLAITSKLVQCLGGTIHVQSQMGEGSTFSFTLPEVEVCSVRQENEMITQPMSPSEQQVNVNRKRTADGSVKSLLLESVSLLSLPNVVEVASSDSSCTPPPSPPVAIKPSPGLVAQPGREDDTSLSELKVLIAEDNVVNQKVLRRALERLGVSRVDVAENGQQAVTRTLQAAYDVVFMDLQMPVMDGIEATKIIAARARHPKVVVLTAHAAPEFQERARRAGAVDFVTKPFRQDKIREVLLRG